MLTERLKNCHKHLVCGNFGVFRFLLTSGTIVQQSSQENEIQNFSQQPTACRKHFFDTLSRTFRTAFCVLTDFYVFAAFAPSFRSPFFDRFSDFSQNFLFTIDEIAINIYYIKYILKKGYF